MVQKPTGDIQIEVPEEMESGVFSNIARVNASENEVVLSFAFTPPGTAKAKVVSRVILTKAHALELNQVIADVAKKASGQ